MRGLGAVVGALLGAMWLLPGCYLAHSLEPDAPGPVDASVARDASSPVPPIDAGRPHPPIDEPEPEGPPPDTRVVQLSAGRDHVCALSESRDVYCWGANGVGQLGISSLRSTTRPARVRGLPPIASVSAGANHTCAVDEEGGLWCWGFGGNQQLGLRRDALPDCGRTDCSPVPLRVPDLPVVERAWLGANGTCVRLEDGEVRCWGHDGGARAVSRAALRDVVDLGLGAQHACALTPEARVRCVGEAAFGRLGDGDRGDGWVDLPEVSELEVGTDHACVLLADARVLCWGYNWSGALGMKSGLPFCRDGDTGGECAPTPRAPDGHPTASSLSIGGGRSCIVELGGTVTCWGPWTIESGTIACGGGREDECDYSLFPVPGIEAPVAIEVGESVSCAIVDAGGVVCWGWGGDGQLGNGTRTREIVREPVRVIGFGS